MKRILGALLVLTVVYLTAVVPVYSIGVLFSRPIGSSQNYNKVWIKSVDATVHINGQVADTHVDQIYKNEMNQTVEAVWIFPLPEGAVMTELYYWFNGIRYKADIRERQQARQDYESKIRQRLDPALLEYLGDNLFRLSIAPINANTDVRSEITYVELLPYAFGTIGYTFLMDAVELSPKPLNRVSVDITVETQSPIKYLKSPTHATSTATKIIRVNDKKYQVLFGDENFTPDRDLKVVYETVRSGVDVNVLRYTPVPTDSIGTDSFYAAWITPPDSIAADEIIPRKIVFTADVSSSMEGVRISQLKQAINAFLDNLSTNDYFNIVTFGTTVVPYKPNLIAASPQAVQAAKTFVTDIGAVGLTNIDEAMKQSLAQSFSTDCANMIMFITDGYPTWGETFVPTILQNVKIANTKSVRIFSFGVGEDVSKPLIVQMATENGGYATFIQASDSIAQVVKNHLTRVSKPVLANLNIRIDGLVTSDKFPRPLPDLFWGSQVMQLGLYQNAGTFPVNLTGTVRGQDKQFQASAEFSKSPGGYRFVPRLWANAKIDYLLDQIAMYGEKAELKNQVIELSLRFQILTPYTAFYSDPTPSQVVERVTVAEKPSEFQLVQNYPNPFNSETTIRFALPSKEFVTIKVFDINGKLIRILAEGSREAGRYELKWDGLDFRGIAVPSGVYICSMAIKSADGKTMVKNIKMGLMK